VIERGAIVVAVSSHFARADKRNKQTDIQTHDENGLAGNHSTQL
jgi:hypothetical protein